MAGIETDQRVDSIAVLGLWVGNIEPRVSKGVIGGVLSRAVTEHSIDMEVSIIADRLDIPQTVSQPKFRQF